MNYKNTQIGTAIIVIFGSIASLLIFILFNNSDIFSTVLTPIWICLSIIVVFSVLFSSLTICIQDSKVEWFFALGFWRKSHPLNEIKSVKIINTKWYYGLGIRLIPTGWLYSVSGTIAGSSPI